MSGGGGGEARHCSHGQPGTRGNGERARLRSDVDAQRVWLLLSLCVSARCGCKTRNVVPQNQSRAHSAAAALSRLVFVRCTTFPRAGGCFRARVRPDCWTIAVVQRTLAQMPSLPAPPPAVLLRHRGRHAGGAAAAPTRPAAGAAAAGAAGGGPCRAAAPRPHPQPQPQQLRPSPAPAAPRRRPPPARFAQVPPSGESVAATHRPRAAPPPRRPAAAPCGRRRCPPPRCAGTAPPAAGAAAEAPPRFGNVALRVASSRASCRVNRAPPTHPLRPVSPH